MLRASRFFLLVLFSAELYAAQSVSLPPVIQPHRAKPAQKSATASKSTAAPAEATLLVSCDLACTFTFDGEDRGHLEADASVKLKASAGQHLVVAVAEGSGARLVQTVFLDSARQTLLRLGLKAILRDQQAAAQRAQQQATAQREQQDELARKKARADALDAQATKLAALSRYQEAFPIFLEACEDGNLQACDFSGDQYELGQGVVADSAMASRYYRRACDGGYANGCKDLGRLLSHGARDAAGAFEAYAHARRAYRAACDAGNRGSCEELGNLLLEGKGGERDLVLARDLMLKSCQAGSAFACVSVGDLDSTEPGLPHDEAQALAYYQRACSLWQGWCDRSAAFYAEGRSVPRDAAYAHQLYQKACRAGNRAACSK